MVWGCCNLKLGGSLVVPSRHGRFGFTLGDLESACFDLKITLTSAMQHERIASVLLDQLVRAMAASFKLSFSCFHHGACKRWLRLQVGIPPNPPPPHPPHPTSWISPTHRRGFLWTASPKETLQLLASRCVPQTPTYQSACWGSFAHWRPAQRSECNVGARAREYSLGIPHDSQAGTYESESAPKSICLGCTGSAS